MAVCAAGMAVCDKGLTSALAEIMFNAIRPNSTNTNNFLSFIQMFLLVVMLIVLYPFGKIITVNRDFDISALNLSLLPSKVI